jgi:hypothetical protein
MASLTDQIFEAEEKLEKAGFNSKQAKAQVAVLSSFIENQVVTKTDLAELKLSLLLWMGGMWFAAVTSIITVLFKLVK